jgi:hypothetical protein
MTYDIIHLILAISSFLSLGACFLIGNKYSELELENTLLDITINHERKSHEQTCTRFHNTLSELEELDTYLSTN